MENVKRVPTEANGIPNILSVVYRTDALMTVGAVYHGGGSASVDFSFPYYDRCNKDVGHVSSMQFTAAIMEGTYCALEDALLSGMFPNAATPEWFYRTSSDWVLLRLNTLFRRSLRFEEVGQMNFRLLDIGTQRLRKRRLSATVEYDGCCSGETMWVINPPEGLNL